jgi:CHAT domain-containing protein
VADVFEFGEEFVGLPAGLLEAGAPAVVASLWPVSEVSTTFLMDRFYELWLGHETELTVAEALQKATSWLRDATKADLLARLAASPLSPKARATILRTLSKIGGEEAAHLLEKASFQEAGYVLDGVVASVAMEILSKPGDRPFAAPYYWAAFAAYGSII